MGRASGGSHGTNKGDVKVPVAGKIDSVAWSKYSVTPGDEVTLTANLSGYADAPSVEFSIHGSGAWGPVEDPIATIAGKGDAKKSEAKWKPAADAALPLQLIAIAKAGTVKRQSTPAIVKGVEFESLQWQPPLARLGDTVQLVLTVKGVKEGTEVKLRIMEDDATGGDDLVKELSAKVDGHGVVQVSWTVPKDMDADKGGGGRLRDTGDPHGHGLDYDEVADVQKALHDLFAKKKISVDPGRPSGALDDRTLRAVADFKKKNKLSPENGALDAAFKKKLQAVHEKEMGEPEEEKAGPDELPDYYFEAAIGKHAARSDLLEIIPPWRLSVEIADPGLLATPLVSSAADEATRKADELFALKQRMQALGFHPEPLYESDSSGPPREDTLRWKGAHDHFVTEAKAHKLDASGAKFGAVVSELLHERLVVAEDCSHGTFEKCKCCKEREGNPVLTGKDARILVPGGMLIESMDDPTLKDSYDEATDRYSAPSRRARFEKRFYDANKLLGLVPVAARVQLKTGSGASLWQPAPEGRTVVFELVPAFDDASGDADLKVLEKLGLKDAPRKHVVGHVKKNLDAKSVHRLNAPASVGGKRDGSPVVGSLWAVTGQAPLSNLPAGRWPWKAEAVPGKPNAIRVKTGPDGIAVACFMPARTSGDSYRIKVTLDGTTEESAKVDGDGFGEEYRGVATGRWTVWRWLRIDRYLRKPVPSGDALTSVEEGQGTKAPPIDLKFIAKELAKAFYHVEVAAKATEDWKAEYDKAHDNAIALMNAQASTFGIPDFDYAKLIEKDFAGRPYLMCTAEPSVYRAKADSSKTAMLEPNGMIREAQPIAGTYMRIMAAFLTSNSGAPGITLLQALVPDEATYSRNRPTPVLLSRTGYLQRKIAASAGKAEKGSPISDSTKDVTTIWFTAMRDKRKPRAELFQTVKTQEGTWEYVQLAAGDKLEYAVAYADGSKKTKKFTVGTEVKTLNDYFIPIMQLMSDATQTKNAFIGPSGWSFGVGFEAVAKGRSDKPEITVTLARGTKTVLLDRYYRGANFGAPHAIPSGVAYPVTRTAFVFYGDEGYKDFGYPVSSNALHEVSHLLFAKHQFTKKRKEPDFWKGSFGADHAWDDTCVMSYHKCDGDLCGRCLLAMRGWDLSQVENKRPADPETTVPNLETET